MKVLIVDDNSVRSEKIAASLTENHITTIEQIFQVDCIDAAKRHLQSAYVDVLILDVVLPKRKNDKPSCEHGLSLLQQLFRSTSLNKPEKVIGLTAHLEDLKSFKMEFEKYCVALIEAPGHSMAWKKRLIQSLSYTAHSKLTRVTESSNIRVISIHGIRTFGLWQNKFASLISTRTRGISLHSYKYNYFPLIAFAIPILREREVKRLTHHLEELFSKHSTSTFIIFSHSFGTYLITRAISNLMKLNKAIPIGRLVLSGSVLPRNFDWSRCKKSGIKIINDCADQDYVLWVNECLIPGLGMGGKCGFYGFQDSQLTNRYFNGGHSSYFENPEFMELYWIPLLNLEEEIVPIDKRTSSTWNHEIVEKIVSLFGFFKHYIYLVLFGLLIYKILQLYI